jgi:Flp pilus assembly protein TadD
MGRFDESAQAADKVLVIEPDNLEGLLEAARARIGQNQGFFAIEPAEHAARLAPRDWRPQALRAVALEQAQRDDEALAAHQRALQLAPDNPATLSNLAMFYAAHGQTADAETLLRKAAALPTATPQVRQNLALILGLGGRLDEAERLERHDLPPAVVANNLNYLRAAQAPTTERSWSAMQSAP